MFEIILFFFAAYLIYLWLPEGSIKRLFPAKTAVSAVTVFHKSRIYVPEDSVLKRHFISQIRSQIESELFPMPTDAVLKRHYESMVSSMVQDRLQQLATA